MFTPSQTKTFRHHYIPRICRRTASALLGFAVATGAIAANTTSNPTVEVPVLASSYAESVRCMPEAVWAIPFSLEEQEERLRYVPLETGADGDAEPDLLVRGPDTYRESVACTASVPWDGWDEYSATVTMPDSSLETQEDLPVAELPDEDADEFRTVGAL